MNVQDDINALATAQQTNYSKGDPEEKLVREAVFPIERNNVISSEIVPAESKTLRTWLFDPWVLKLTSGVTVANYNTISVTIVRATDPGTGGYTVYATLSFRQSSIKWGTYKEGLVLRLLFQNSRDGLLEEWPVANQHLVRCTDADNYQTYTKTLRPDWYDELNKAVIIIDPARWGRC